MPDLGYILLCTLVDSLSATATANDGKPHRRKQPKWLKDDGWIRYDGLIDGTHTGDALAKAAAEYFKK